MSLPSVPMHMIWVAELACQGHCPAFGYHFDPSVVSMLSSLLGLQALCRPRIRFARYFYRYTNHLLQRDAHTDGQTALRALLAIKT